MPPDKSLPACDSTTEEILTGKSFSATVTGARSATMSGSALAVESQDASGTSWGVLLSDIESGFGILVAWDSPTPSTGPVPVAEESSATVLQALLTLDNVTDQYLATGGSFNITSSSNTRVEGSFTFDAVYRGLDQSLVGTTVTVQGTFSATNIVDDGSN